MPKPTDFMKNVVDDLKSKDLYWNIHVLQSASTPRAKIDGKNVIMFCSNNYLGLSDHPKLKDAAIAAVKKYGAGSGSVRAIAGTMDLHVELEKKIAKFKHTEAAIFYQSGFTVNSGLIPALLEQGDLVISDELNHGSIIDGVHLTKAERAIYRHKDMEGLEKLLKDAQEKKYGKILVITDGVFSMDGDIAPLGKIVALCKQYNALSYVDDAHGDGVLGDHGRGVSHHFGVAGKVDFDMGTFSKAFGVVGGSVAGSKEMCEFAFNKSRTWLLTGSHPPATVAACSAAMDLLENDDTLVKKLWSNTKYFKAELKKLGFDTGQSETPITPVMLGKSETAKKFSMELFENGVFALPIVFPMVAQDKARIRTMVTAAHEKKDLDDALAAFEKVGKKLSVI